MCRVFSHRPKCHNKKRTLRRLPKDCVEDNGTVRRHTGVYVKDAREQSEKSETIGAHLKTNAFP